MAMPVIAKVSKWSSEDPKKLDRSFIPEERLGTEKDLIGTALYLASRAGAYNNGNVSVLDGGVLGTVPATY